MGLVRTLYFCDCQVLIFEMRGLEYIKLSSLELMDGIVVCRAYLTVPPLPGLVVLHGQLPLNELGFRIGG